MSTLNRPATRIPQATTTYAKASATTRTPPKTFRELLTGPHPPMELLKLVSALSQIRERDLERAQQTLDSVRATIPTSEPGRLSRYLAVRACLAGLRNDPDAGELARDAIGHANRQGAERHRQLALLALAAAAVGTASFALFGSVPDVVGGAA